MITDLIQYDGLSFQCWVVRNISVDFRWHDGDFAIVHGSAVKDAMYADVAISPEKDATCSYTMITSNGTPNMTIHCDKWDLTLEICVDHAESKGDNTRLDVYVRRNGAWVKIT